MENFAEFEGQYNALTVLSRAGNSVLHRMLPRTLTRQCAACYYQYFIYLFIFYFAYRMLPRTLTRQRPSIFSVS
jgi:hypothetical protein